MHSDLYRISNFYRVESVVLVDLEQLVHLASKAHQDHRVHQVPQVTRDLRDLQDHLALTAMKEPLEPLALQVILVPQDLMERKEGEESQDHMVFQAQLDLG